MNWKKFRKKPVVIEAVRWEPATMKVQEEWPGIKDRRIVAQYRDGRLDIETLEGTMIANPGDWIVRGIQGELYPVRDDIFRATYEEVE